MTLSLAGPAADSVLALILNGTAFAGFAGVFVQLHDGPPGAAGTANLAGETVRQAAGSFIRSSPGVWTNAAIIVWNGVPTTETYADCTLWSAASGGTFIASGTVTSVAVLAGGTFQIAPGGLSVSLPVAS